MRSARQESLVVGATGVLARQQEELKPAHLLRRTLSSCGFLVSPPSTLVISSGVRPQPNAVERPCVPLVKNLLSLERRASSPVNTTSRSSLFPHGPQRQSPQIRLNPLPPCGLRGNLLSAVILINNVFLSKAFQGAIHVFRERCRRRLPGQKSFQQQHPKPRQCLVIPVLAVMRREAQQSVAHPHQRRLRRQCAQIPARHGKVPRMAKFLRRVHTSFELLHHLANLVLVPIPRHANSFWPKKIARAQTCARA